MTHISDYVIELFIFISFGFCIGINLVNALQINNLYYRMFICSIIINFFVITLSVYNNNNNKYYEFIEIFP